MENHGHEAIEKTQQGTYADEMVVLCSRLGCHCLERMWCEDVSGKDVTAIRTVEGIWNPLPTT